MYCRFCGKDLRSDDNFCPNCGAKVDDNNSTNDYSSNNYSNYNNQYNYQSNKYNIQLERSYANMATTSLILGILSFSLSILGFAFPICIPGIVMGAVVRNKVEDEKIRRKAAFGIVLSIAGLISSILMLVLYFTWLHEWIWSL